MTLVSIRRVPDDPEVEQIEQSLADCLDDLDFWPDLKRVRGQILIKPNIGCVALPREAANTDPRVAQALVRLLRRAGQKDIVIAESAVIGVDSRDCFAAAGFTEMCRAEGVALVDLKQEAVTEVDVPGGRVLEKVRIFRRALEAELVIDLPKLKTITAVPMSLGMKNLKGLLPDSEKRRFHHLDLSQAVADLSRVVRPGLTVIDGILANDLYRPRPMGLLVAGRNTVATDAVGARVMGLDPAEIRYLTAAAEAGLGSILGEEIAIAGLPLAEVRRPFHQAVSHTAGFKELFPQVDIAEGGACSSCIGVLYRVLSTARDQGFLDRWQGWTLAVGPTAPADAGEKTLFLGNCLKKHQDGQWFPGCPPLSLDLIDYLAGKKGIDK